MTELATAARLRRFLRTPKGLLVIGLAILALLAAFSAGLARVLPGFAAACVAAMATDAVILKVRKRRWVFPDGALLTGMIVAMVLSAHQPAWIAALTAAAAVGSKYALRAGKANVFNPAALALVASYYAFDTGQDWWGSMPDAPIAALLALGAVGAFIVYRVRRTSSVLAFLLAYYSLVTVAAFIGDPAHVAELYRAPDSNMALYFAFFMVTDPPTSPTRERDQVIYGAVTAVVAFAMFEWVHAAYFMLAGVLVANLFAAWRRTHRAMPARIAAS